VDLKTIMHSLKTARPLLANVTYFVLFAMILFSWVLPSSSSFEMGFRLISSSLVSSVSSRSMAHSAVRAS
jgi:hypothetical protein